MNFYFSINNNKILQIFFGENMTKNIIGSYTHIIDTVIYYNKDSNSRPTSMKHYIKTKKRKRNIKSQEIPIKTNSENNYLDEGTCILI